MLILPSDWWGSENPDLTWMEGWLGAFDLQRSLSRDTEDLGVVLWTTPEAEVYPVGVVLLEKGHEFLFAYHPEYLANPDVPDIGHHLPKTDKPYVSKGIHSFFDNLISEGWLGVAQSAALGAMDIDKGRVDLGAFENRDDLRLRFDRMLDFGRNFHGAVSIIPASQERVIGLPEEHVKMNMAVLSRSTVTGMQAKMLVRSGEIVGDRKNLDAIGPYDTSTHIIKLGDPRKPWIIQNELMNMVFTSYLLPKDSVASCSTGITEFVDTGKETVFVTRRFDRTEERGRIQFEEAAQLMNISPASRDESSYESLAKMTLEIAGKDVAKQLFTRLVSQFMLKNTDSHLKNTAFWKDEKGDWQLTPNYDLVSSANYFRGEGRDRERMSRLALRLTGKVRYTQLHEVNPKFIFALGALFGVDTEGVKEVVDQLRERFEGACEAVMDLSSKDMGLDEEVAQEQKEQFITTVRGQKEHMLKTFDKYYDIISERERGSDQIGR